MLKLTKAQTRLLRLRSQGLAQPAAGSNRSVAQVVRDACGLQAQDGPAAILGVRARSAGLTAAEVEDALYTRHTLAHTWCMRGTLHMLAAEDLVWMLPLFGPLFSARGRRRNLELGLDENALRTAVAVIRSELAGQELMTRQELAVALEAHGVPTAGQALIHAIAQAALEGHVLVGPKVGGKLTYTLLENWTGPLRPLERETALVELARRYLDAFGPAGVEDFAAWSGLSMPDARLGWEGIAAEIVPVEAAGRAIYFPATRRSCLEEPAPPEPQVRLLPFFDSYLLGYARRDLLMDERNKAAIFTGGVIQSVVLVDGRAAGTWRILRRSKALEIVVEPFEVLSPAVRAGLEEEANDIGRFLGAEARISLLK